ncbi:MAG: hypothetical protein V5B78_13125, partial [Desulfohalobiaceae bacterium]
SIHTIGTITGGGYVKSRREFGGGCIKMSKLRDLANERFLGSKKNKALTVKLKMYWFSLNWTFRLLL